MDDILGLADEYVLTPYVYPVTWKEDDVMRQTLSLFAMVNIGAYMLYLITASLTYMFLFDKRLMKHPHFLKVWIWLYIDPVLLKGDLTLYQTTSFFVCLGFYTVSTVFQLFKGDSSQIHVSWPFFFLTSI